MSSSTPTLPWTKPGARSSPGRAGTGGVWSGGKRWLLLTRWHHLQAEGRLTLRELFAVNRRLAKAYQLREMLERLWTYTYEGAARRFLTTWIHALRWQRLPAFQQFTGLLLRHHEYMLLKVQKFTAEGRRLRAA